MSSFSRSLFTLKKKSFIQIYFTLKLILLDDDVKYNIFYYSLWYQTVMSCGINTLVYRDVVWNKSSSLP